MYYGRPSRSRDLRAASRPDLLRRNIAYSFICRWANETHDVQIQYVYVRTRRLRLAPDAGRCRVLATYVASWRLAMVRGWRGHTRQNRRSIAFGAGVACARCVSLAARLSATRNTRNDALAHAAELCIGIVRSTLCALECPSSCARECSQKGHHAE